MSVLCTLTLPAEKADISPDRDKCVIRQKNPNLDGALRPTAGPRPTGPETIDHLNLLQ